MVTRNPLIMRIEKYNKEVHIVKRIPRVFIGSSKESKEIANLVMKELCDTGEYDCVIRDENFFELNEGTYKTLV